MSNIPNTEYITVKRDEKGRVGVFVGGKRATKYRNEDIYDVEYVKSVFKWMQQQHSNIAEFQIMSSITEGEYAVAGNPSAEHGPNAWCRIVLKDGTKAAWVFNGSSSSAADCASDCAANCAFAVRGGSAFRAAVFGTVRNPELEKLQKIDFSKLPNQFEVNGYNVVLEKVKERQYK